MIRVTTWTAAEVDRLSPDRARTLRTETQAAIKENKLTRSQQEGALEFVRLLDRRLSALDDVPVELRIADSKAALGLVPSKSASFEDAMRQHRRSLYNDPEAKDGRVRRG